MWAFVAIKGPSPSSNKAAAGAASGDRKGAYASGMLGKQGAQLFILDYLRETVCLLYKCILFFINDKICGKLTQCDIFLQIGNKQL